MKYHTCRWCRVTFIGGTTVFDSALQRWSDHTWTHAVVGL